MGHPKATWVQLWRPATYLKFNATNDFAKSPKRQNDIKNYKYKIY
jgi:hypothetical protein